MATDDALKEYVLPADLGPRAQLLTDKHAAYIVGFAQQTDTFEYYATEHFRLSGVYWGVTALALLGRLDALNKGAWRNLHSNGHFVRGTTLSIKRGEQNDGRLV